MSIIHLSPSVVCRRSGYYIQNHLESADVTGVLMSKHLSSVCRRWCDVTMSCGPLDHNQALRRRTHFDLLITRPLYT